jgi:hypothetical protein
MFPTDPKPTSPATRATGDITRAAANGEVSPGPSKLRSLPEFDIYRFNRGEHRRLRVSISRPVRQSRLPASTRFSLSPGVSTVACCPRRIHIDPTFGLVWTSTSSMNTAVSSAGSS